MYDASFVEECEVGDIIDAVKLWWIHLGKGIQGHNPSLDRERMRHKFKIGARREGGLRC